jgi:hypothetical protein
MASATFPLLVMPRLPPEARPASGGGVGGRRRGCTDISVLRPCLEMAGALDDTAPSCGRAPLAAHGFEPPRAEGEPQSTTVSLLHSRLPCYPAPTHPVCVDRPNTLAVLLVTWCRRCRAASRPCWRSPTRRSKSLRHAAAAARLDLPAITPLSGVAVGAPKTSPVGRLPAHRAA